MRKLLHSTLVLAGLFLWSGLVPLRAQRAATDPKASEQKQRLIKPANQKTLKTKANKTKANEVMKIVDWTAGPDKTVHIPTGTATVSTHVATFRFIYEGQNIDVPFIAFKHAATSVCWVGPVFQNYALVNDSFFGFDPPRDSGTMTLGHSDYTPTKIPMEKTIEQILAQFDELPQLPNVGLLYQSLHTPRIFGREFFTGIKRSAGGQLPLAQIKTITTDGTELSVKFEGHAPTATAELVFGGSGEPIGILRAYVNGKGVPVAYTSQ